MSGLNKAVTLQALGKDWSLQFSTNAMVIYEEDRGEPFTAVNDHFKQAAEGRISILTMRALIWAGLSDFHSGTPVNIAGDIIDDAGFTTAMEAVAEAIALAFPESDPSAKPGNGRGGKKAAG